MKKYEAPDMEIIKYSPDEILLNSNENSGSDGYYNEVIKP